MRGGGPEPRESLENSAINETKGTQERKVRLIWMLDKKEEPIREGGFIRSP